MNKELRKKARWHRRVDEAAEKMKAGLKEKEACQDMDQDFLDAWLHCIAADILWTTDQMKKPGLLHQVFRRNQ